MMQLRPKRSNHERSDDPCVQASATHLHKHSHTHASACAHTHSAQSWGVCLHLRVRVCARAHAHTRVHACDHYGCVGIYASMLVTAAENHYLFGCSGDKSIACRADMNDQTTSHTGICATTPRFYSQHAHACTPSRKRACRHCTTLNQAYGEHHPAIVVSTGSMSFSAALESSSAIAV